MEEETEEIDVIEIVLNDKEISELAGKLEELKETKKPVSFMIDEDNELMIHHEDEEGEEENGRI
ncbi:MAG: hypothetical protein KKA64_01765 [Nanoarchaeota archaeon]|nr:hypothetical protein [Nanoarchaeota archaeon]